MTAALVAPHDGVMADDPAARPRRRRFSPEYKLAILAEYDPLTEPGDKGALLRREGMYTSHIVEWRRAREAGALAGLAGQGRARKRTPEQVELDASVAAPVSAPVSAPGRPASRGSPGRARLRPRRGALPSANPIYASRPQRPPAFATQLGSFNLVVAVEVIEHLQSPIGFLRCVHD